MIIIKVIKNLVYLLYSNFDIAKTYEFDKSINNYDEPTNCQTIKTNYGLSDCNKNNYFVVSIRRVSQIRQPPTYLKDYQVTINTTKIRRMSRNKNHISFFMSYERLSPCFRLFMFVVQVYPEPKSYKETCKYPHWRATMNGEIMALENNNIGYVTSLSKNKYSINYRWVIKIKRKVDDSLDRYKARLVIKDYTQLEELDFLDAFSPVVKLTTIRLIFLCCRC